MIQMIPVSDEQRKLFHAAFNDWMSHATEVEFEQLEQARDLVAPGEVSSMLTLVRRCLSQQDLVEKLPASLLQQLRERNWLRPSVVSKSA